MFEFKTSELEYSELNTDFIDRHELKHKFLLSL